MHFVSMFSQESYLSIDTLKGGIHSSMIIRDRLTDECLKPDKPCLFRQEELVQLPGV